MGLRSARGVSQCLRVCVCDAASSPDRRRPRRILGTFVPQCQELDVHNLCTSLALRKHLMFIMRMFMLNLHSHRYMNVERRRHRAYTNYVSDVLLRVVNVSSDIKDCERMADGIAQLICWRVNSGRVCQLA